MLSAMDKILVMVTGGAVVAVVLIIVVCVVAPICPIHRLLPERIRIEEGNPRRRRRSFRMEKDNKKAELSLLNASSYHHGYGPKVDDCVIMSPMKITTVQPTQDNNANNSTMAPRRPVVLLTSQESMVDSTYSSMTPSESRPSSPVSSKSDPSQDASSNESSLPSFPPTVDASPVYGSVIFKLAYIADETGPGKGNLIIDIREALDLPVRDNQTYGDPFVRVFVTKQRRSLRRPKKSTKLIAHFETAPCKRTRNPVFSREFQLPITRSEMKDCELRVAVYDRDKYTGPTAWGESTVALRDVDMSTSASQMCLELAEPTHYQGEVLIGLMYLPTAERMTVTISKASHLRYQDIVSDVKDLNLHAKALLLRNGRLVGKKKTASHCGSPEVTFEESVAFDVPTEHLNNLKLVVTVVHRDSSESSEMSNVTMEGGAAHYTDKYFGKIVLGGESHWETSIQRPREQVLRWHVLR